MAKNIPSQGTELLTISLWRLKNNIGQTWSVTVSEKAFPMSTPALEKRPAGIIFKMITTAVLGG